MVGPRAQRENRSMDTPNDFQTTVRQMWDTRPPRIPKDQGGNALLGGVCEGIGARYRIDPVLVRIMFVVLALAFGGVGFGGILAVVRGRSAVEEALAREARHPEAPWLWREDWAARRITDSSMAEMGAAWAFAILWNLISIPSAVLAVRAALQGVREHAPDALIVGDTSDLVRSELDVYAPCALGGALDHEVVGVLNATVVCGAANNQLVDDDVDNRLQERGIVYCPDYLVNAGGVIQVSDELHGFSFERAKAKATSIRAATMGVLRTADAEGITPSEAADRLAERRIAAVGGLRRIWTGR